MGYLAAALLMAAAWDRNDPPSIVLRGIGLTCFFATGYLSERRKRQPGAGTSTWELRSFVFAIFCALLTMALGVAYLWDLWNAWGG